MFSKYYFDDGSPKECSICGNSKFKDRIEDYVQNTPSEVTTICTNCGATVSFWAYGSYDPRYKKYGAVK